MTWMMVMAHWGTSIKRNHCCYVISNIFAFPTITSQNVCCKKKLYCVSKDALRLGWSNYQVKQLYEVDKGT